MDATRLMNSTATIIAKTGQGAVDEMGNPTVTTATSEHRCWLWQTNRSENTAGTDVQAETFQIGIDPEASDLIETVVSVEVDGISYQFDGPPWAVKHPRHNTVSHIEATLRRTR